MVRGRSAPIPADLPVPPTGRLVVFGPNGAGKSTLLRHEFATRTDVAYLPQHTWMLRGPAHRTLTIGLGRMERARAEEWARQLGVADTLDRRGRSLSGGEQKRVNLARVLASNAKVLLLDEPLAPIDRLDRGLVIRSIAEAAEGRVAVVVAHDRDVVAMLATEVAVLVDGVVRQQGPVAEVMHAPASEDIARVIGVENVLVGAISDVTDAMCTVVCGPVSISARRSDSLDLGDRVAVMFGAETVLVSLDDATTSAQNHWGGTVDSIVRLGSLVQLTVNVGVPVIAVITPAAQDALEVEQGTAVFVSVKATAVRAVERA
ncbi:hypothetical protein MNBD_ACTINO02-2206 [hydrothermal vent metagenome]|uniref:Molybdenum transport ATP-binding protein ModC (TC 3.A.1.8.1) n=1 Tax=hydrothermal vent metagenome TaxID=652676 RepID=A0A3B0SUP2_9ZZZZ